MSRPPLFIHIPKNAGTSIKNNLRVISVSEKYVSKYRQDPIHLDPMSSHTLASAATSFVAHTPFNLLEKGMVSTFDRKFAVVRNPWARVASLYNYSQSNTMKSFKGTWYYEEPISWELFLDRMDSFKMTPNYYWAPPYKHWGNQSDWVMERGKVKVDILRYENLKKDLENYFDQSIDLPYMNKGPEVDYRTYYTDEQAEKIAKWFNYDIQLWGFSFESGATKNYWTS